jgi:mevalonate pyrophosphate decarboxylase
LADRRERFRYSFARFVIAAVRQLPAHGLERAHFKIDGGPSVKLFMI